jgi:hypothetical protein
MRIRNLLGVAVDTPGWLNAKGWLAAHARLIKAANIASIVGVVSIFALSSGLLSLVDVSYQRTGPGLALE